MFGPGTVDMLYIEFRKAFDIVLYNDLIKMLHKLGLNPWLILWIHNWIKDRYQSVAVNEVHLVQKLVTSGVS